MNGSTSKPLPPSIQTKADDTFILSCILSAPIQKQCNKTYSALCFLICTRDHSSLLPVQNLPSPFRQTSMHYCALNKLVSLEWYTFWSTDWPGDLLVNRLAWGPAGQPTGRGTCWSTDWHGDLLVNRLAWGPAGQQTGMGT